jgi:nucleotide-binding universal stress UspA family protein
MFTEILLPSDGSIASGAVIRKCMAFAKSIGARVTGIHVMPEFNRNARSAITLEQDIKSHEARARQILAEIECEAKELGVPCATRICTGSQPYEQIIDVARNNGCDLICMASHGRHGAKGVLLGSETQKVLTHSPIPVLVFR